MKIDQAGSLTGNNFKKVVISISVATFIAGIIIGLLIRGGSVENSGGNRGGVNAESTILLWTCSMHPQIKQDGPGQCPICGMDLTSLKEDTGGDRASLKLGERAKQLAGVRTSMVDYKELTKSIYTVGKINYDESRVAHVTSWMGGRIDKLYVNFTGTNVQKGEHLVYIYSPELVSSQEEYLIAYRGIKALTNDGFSSSSAGSESLLKNSRDRLLQWGVTEEQINQLEQTQKADSHLTIFAPVGGTVIQKNIFEGMYVKTGDRLFTICDLSRVWLYLDIYEYDLSWVRYGQSVAVTTESFPGTTFHGTVVFIEPFLDDKSRTVRIRVNMDNSARKLKPGMYANASIKVKFGSDGVILNSDIEGKYMCPMHPDIISDNEGKCPECGMNLEPIGKNPYTASGSMVSALPAQNLSGVDSNRKGVLAVPHSAVLYTGLRNIVYVENRDGNYEPREITLGPKADNYYHVVAGLEPQEKVVTHGNFLIDSQMQLLGKPSLLFPEGSQFKDHGHDHGKDEHSSHVVPAEPDIDKTTFPIYSDSMEAFFTAYFSVRNKLAGDSIEGIDNDISLMEANIIKANKAEIDLDGDIKDSMKKQLEHIGHYVAAMKGKPLSDVRDTFKTFNKELIEYVKEFHSKIKGGKKMYLFYCPMANGRWFQENDDLGNPYHGSSMLKCGLLEKEI